MTPNTTYKYRIVLTCEQVHVYQSEDFTSPPLLRGRFHQQSKRNGQNVASSGAGATVIGISTDFGSGDNDSGFGASNTADGKTNTEWSSHGDGDDAGIEIEMDRTYDQHTMGFWARLTSNDTAQIFTFSVTTDTGETLGPFELPDSGHTCYLPMEFTARTPGVDAPTTNPVNTGAMEIQVYGTPHGE